MITHAINMYESFTSNLLMVFEMQTSKLNHFVTPATNQIKQCGQKSYEMLKTFQ